MIWQPYIRVSERGSSWHEKGIESSVDLQAEQIAGWIRYHDPAAAVLPPPVVKPAIASLWAGAAVGAFGRLYDRNHGTSYGAVAYLGLGWSGIVLLPLVVRRHGVRAGALLTAGGVAYTVGAALFAARKPNPFPEVFGYHEVWHTATLVGAAFHLAAIAEVTRDGERATETDTEGRPVEVGTVIEADFSQTATADPSR
jgi:hypothetical protein